MTELVVRKLLVDLTTPFASRWNGGDAFRSAFFSALSMSFPVGEQYFMDSVRNGLKTLPEDQRQRYAKEVQGFVGQEATHRRVHALFNGHLDKMGYPNTIEQRAIARIKKQAHLDPRMHVAATAATEHFTALFADWMLRHPEALEGAEPRLQTLWLWHSAEESEHRSTAFDVYQAMGGNHVWRIRSFYYVSVIFMWDLARQTVRNLWHDGSLFKWSTWRSGKYWSYWPYRAYR
jgi:predicted metal-dependent hydrolase